MPVVEAKYTPAMYDISTIDDAKFVIVGTVGEDPLDHVDTRWEKETQWLTADIFSKLALTEKSRVLDYACGIGRVAKKLIELSGCNVLGVDISASMRKFSVEYVASEKFSVVSPLEFRMMAMRGEKFDCAYACWALQHFADPAQAIDVIKLSLRKDALFYVLNEKNRWVPTTIGWVDDKISVEKILRSRFNLLEESKLSTDAASEWLSNRSQIFLLSKP